MKTIHVIGNIGKAVEMKFTPAGKAVTEFSVAVNEGKGDKKVTEWIKVTAWDKAAEILNQYAKTGHKIYLSGTCKIESWIDKNSGAAKAQLVLTVREFEFLSPAEVKTEQREQHAAALADEDYPF
jgi:single-strand DNA-binding protein